MTLHVFPNLATKADFDRAVERLETQFDKRIESTRLDLIQRIDKLGHDLTVRMFSFTLAIVGLMNGIPFALLRVVPPPH